MHGTSSSGDHCRTGRILILESGDARRTNPAA
jgi:hypothetical protein